MSTDTQSLAEQIIIFSGATTPYDKAKAVEQWLRENIAYDETISAPPFDKDPIDWFLFDIQRGYCNYYASAMVMMLRSQGIPARMAAGFAQGSYDAVDRTYLVRENDAHTWVEVFFPGYGWVEFEPTADEVPLERPGDVAFNQDFPTITPEPSPTMTPFPTNTPPEQQALPTATPTASPTQAPAEQLPATTLTPEFQPTATPTPTPESTAAAPAITDVEAQDDDTDLLETILLILGILLTIAVVLLLLAAFVIWWVEYRGLGGLNPIQKSYARLGIYGGWLGLRLSNRQTPIERRRVLVDAVPDGEQPINTITSLYTRDKYGKPAPEATQGEAVERARRAWVEARWAFIFTKFRRRQR